MLGLGISLSLNVSSFVLFSLNLIVLGEVFLDISDEIFFDMLKKCTVVVQQVFFFFEVTVLLDLGPPCSGAWGLEGVNFAGSHCVQHKFRAAHR